MLDVMRRNIKSLAVTLWVVIGAFILFIFVDWGMGRVDQTTGRSVIATVDKTPIYVDDYQDEFYLQMRRLREIYQSRMDKQMLRAMGIDQQVLQRLITQEVLVVEAERQGLMVSDAELRAAIVDNPSFQENGKFIGSERYQQILIRNRKTPAQFEETLRRELMSQKLVQTVTMPLSVSEREAREAYYAANEKVKISYVVVKAKGEPMEIPEAELKEFFEKNHDRFDMPERRKGQYVLIDTEKLRQQVNLTPKDIEQYYKENSQQFQLDEEVGAQKVLINWEKHGGRDAARTLAEQIVSKATAGEDFAALARAHSDDPTAQSGGDVGTLFKGGLSEIEEDAVFGTPEGGVTQPIETADAWVVYRVKSKTPARVRPLQEAETQIRSVLTWQKAREAMEKKTAEILRVARESKSLEAAAKQNNLTVQTTGLLGRNDEVPELRDAGQFANAIFDLKAGEINGPLHVGSGSAIYTLLSTEAPRKSSYEEVAEKVKKDLSARKRKEEAAATAQAMLAELTAGGKPEDVAKKAGLDLKEHEFTRNSSVPELGSSSYIDDIAFGMEAGAPWAGPVLVKDGACVFTVVSKTPVSAEQFEKEKTEYARNLTEDRRGKFFEAYTDLLKKRHTISINSDILAQVNESLYGQAQ